MKKSNILGIISILIPSILLLLILNFIWGLVPIDKIQGLPVIMPFVLCPIGAIIGFFSYKINRDKVSLIGIAFNVIMFLFPIGYHVFGTLIFGT